MKTNLSLKGLINNSVKPLSKIAGISLALMIFASFDANSQTVRLETEDGTLGGALTVETTLPGYSGTGYVSAVAGTTDWAPISMTIDVATAGYYNLEVGYANTSGVKANIALFANDAWIGSSSMVYPVNTSLEKITFGLIELNAGVNKIAINVADATIDLDYVDVTYVADPTNTGFYEAEDAIHNGVVAANQRPYSGLGHLDHDNGNTVTITFNVNVASAGSHTLVIKHGKTGARMISINGAEGVYQDLVGVGNTNEFTTTELEIQLNAGDNTIAFLPSWGGVLFDYIDIVTDPSMSISENVETSFNVYPNPVSNGVLNIQTEGNASSLVTITNLVGQEVFTAEFTNNTQISTSDFNKGLYLVTIKSGNNVSTKKVIIE